VSRNALISYLAVPAALMVSMALLGAGCSDSTSPGGDGDTTPPGLSAVTPTDQSHIEVTFDEQVDETSAEHQTNYLITLHGLESSESARPKLGAAPGDTLQVSSSVLLSSGSEVMLSVDPPMQAAATYRLIARNIQDLHGNTMTEADTMDFVGVGTQDDTPPEIVDRSPAPGETGVGIGQSVMVTFSEPMAYGSIQAAFTWTGPGDTDVPYDSNEMESHIFIFTPRSSLEHSTTYTVGFAANTATDMSSNYLAAATWSFTTTGATDVVAPTVVSTTPADGATNVPLDITFQIEFSEPIDPYSLAGDNIVVTPPLGDGTVSWTDGGTTMNFVPDVSLLDDTAYSLNIAAGAVSDYAGNLLSGNYTAAFTTASSLPAGSYSGTLSGDPSSTGAADPEGALSIAFMINMFGDGSEGQPPIGGADVVGPGGSYEIEHLPDDTYWPAAMMDSDGNGVLSPDYGDAIGIYGLDLATMTGEPDSVVIEGGSTVSGIDFALYDPVAIWGDVYYAGTAYASDLASYMYYPGLFDVSTFDPENPVPDYTGHSRNIVEDPEFKFSELGDGLTEGTYYIGAYLDVNFNAEYDAAIDPAGYYETDEQLIGVTVENGEDSGDGIVVVIYDPSIRAQQLMGKAAWTASNPSRNRLDPKLRRLLENIRRIRPSLESAVEDMQ
jgi:hypothetical protein